MSLGGIAEPAGSPRTKGDEVKLLFQLFDQDQDGKVTGQDMKLVLQKLDPALWTDSRVEKVLSLYDGNGDDALQFTEFWSWVCGHGGRSTDDFKPALLSFAIEEDRQRRAEAQERKERAEERRQKREEKEAAKVRKEQERAEGKRVSRKEFIAEQMNGAGFTKEVATEIFNLGDEDRDGDIDSQERMWLAASHVATTKQIRELYQKSGGSKAIDAKGNLVLKDVSASGMDAVVNAFLMWDKDGSGKISPEELGQVLATINPNMGKTTVEALCQEIDTNQDGSIDLNEFLDWLTGEAGKKKKMSKKVKEEQDARLGYSLHKKRAAEAVQQGVQTTFEQAMHTALQSWCVKKKLVVTCNTVNAGPNPKQICKGCNQRHGWLCHGCGFVCFVDDCPYGCDKKHGWSCITGVCGKKKCGCKKKPDVWMKTGNVHGIADLTPDVKKIILEKTTSASSSTEASTPEPPA